MFSLFQTFIHNIDSNSFIRSIKLKFAYALKNLYLAESMIEKIDELKCLRAQTEFNNAVFLSTQYGRIVFSVISTVLVIRFTFAGIKHVHIHRFVCLNHF